MAKGLFDLEKHFAFYGAYHSDPINIFIHTLFVWPLFYTALMLFYFTPPLFQLPQFDLLPFQGSTGLVFNFGFLFALLYAIFYMGMDMKAGTLAALLCFLCWVSSSSIASRLGFSLAWKVVLVAQLFCWTWQFIGHGVFEKRAPALLDNIAQAFLMAPFFVLLEVLQRVFEYEPYPGFHANVVAKIAANRNEWEAQKQKKHY
ncbi:2-hydroxy-palmitic acid dioxygenase mpo1-like [Aristolochia californica]|uniref:2-hydroxy-palmitic acid dioxygenase mpo1-like n=1 Tax=Aristolochia californica TaxID=171875 RepID=UPI0035DFA7B6